MPTRIAPNVRRLIEGALDSFEKLELVLALFRSTRPLTIAHLERSTDLELEHIRKLLGELRRAGLVEVERAEAGELHGAGQIVRLVPKDDDGAALSELAQLHDEDPVAVVRVLSTVAMERIRGMAARTFADAFQLRPKKDDKTDGKKDEDDG